MEVGSATSNSGSGKDFNSLNGLSKMEIANPYISVSEAVSKILFVNVSLKRIKHRQLHWMLPRRTNEDGGDTRLQAGSWWPQNGSSLQERAL